MILILDGNSEIAAQMGSEICILIDFKTFVWMDSSHKFETFLTKPVLFHACAMFSELPSGKNSVIKAAWGVTNRKCI